MSLTLEQALHLVASDPTYSTQEGLLDLVRQTSVATPADGPGKTPVTLAYSGSAGPNGLGPSMSTYADYVARTYADNVRVFNNTALANFVSSREFEAAGLRAFGGNQAAYQNWLFHATEGPLALGSQLFMEAAPGRIELAGPFAAPERAFAQVEVKAGLNSAAPSIVGVPREELASFREGLIRNGLSEFEANSRISEVLSVGSRLHSQSTGVAWVTDTLADGTTRPRIVWAEVSRLTGGPASAADIPPNATRGTLSEFAGPPSFAERLAYRHLAELPGAGYASYLTAFERTGAVLGTVGGALAYASLLNTAYQASDAFQAGDPARALELIRDWSLGNVGGAFAGAMAFSGARLLLPLVMPLGTLGIGTAVVLAVAGSLWAAYQGAKAGIALGQGISTDVNALFFTSSATRQPTPRDPLAIDLDGDGIETTGLAHNPVLFDHNADGIRAGTGWVRPDDAWLVLDRNGNDVIDSGRELFGVDTVVSGTPGVDAMYASSGFQALRVLDSNADNQFSGQDVAFRQVRLWQDFNQDGISQGSELFSLTDRGISSIALNANTSNTNLGNGNSVSGTATVSRVNGTTTHVNSVNVATDTTAANLNLANNPFYRQFTTPVTVAAGAETLPEMRGSGWVRDLREAMSLGTPAGDALSAKVTEFAASPTRDAQHALLDDIVRLWGETNTTQLVPPADDPLRRFALSGDAATSARLQREIPILEVFNGMGVDEAGMQTPTLSVNASGQTVRTYTLFANQAPIMLAAYDALKESVYAALVTQTRLQPYLDAIELAIDENGFRFDFSGAVALVQTKAAMGAYNAVGDLIDLMKYVDGTLSAIGWEPYEALNAVLSEATITPEIQSLLNSENIQWVGATGTNYTVSGSQGATVLGNANANTLVGSAGNDELYGLGGNDTLSAWGGTNLMDGGDGDDVITGTAGWGNGSTNTLIGGAGNDTLSVHVDYTNNNVFDGGAGTDSISGSRLSDTYRFNLGNGIDNVSEPGNPAAGYADKIVMGAGIAPSDIAVFRSGDTLVFRHANGVDQLNVNNWFVSPAYQIEQIVFDDGTVWDAPRVSASVATPLNGTAGADGLIGTVNTDQLNGLDANDTLDGLAGNDWLDGGAGVDTMRGGAGDDVYVVDDAAEVVTELANEGRDAVRTSITWTLAANVEDLVLTGTSAINGTGNLLDNVLYGNSAANVLAGGAGNDRYYVGTGDTVTEASNAGIDTVVSNVTWTLGTNVENLVLVESGAINGTGNSMANVLTGNDAANTLSGGTGADTMIGGLGDDTYVVDNAGDVVTELAGQGTDRVNAAVTYALPDQVENLTLTGSTAINGTGNASNNALTGNSAANTLSGGAGDDLLNGGAGADTMQGGAGNDTYTVDNASDVIVEAANEGTDRVNASVTTTLSANVENLMLTGTTAINGTGNASNNVLTGNSANNALTANEGDDYLDGLGGTDTMLGGSGNDTYVVAQTGDVVTENANEGIDTVRSGITYTLGSNVENLVLTGMTAINGTGNTLDNALTGNSANNSLIGNAGADTLDGGAGTDTLTGGTGNDTYQLGRGYGADTIVENDATAGNTDIAKFLAGVASDQIWFRRAGNNLEASIIGTSDRFVAKDWYLGSQYHVEQFRTTDGNKALLEANVQNLVNAMAAFSPPAAGETTLPAAYQTALAPVIAANWQ